MRRGRERENLNLREIRNGKRERMRNNKCDKTLAMNHLNGEEQRADFYLY